MAGAGGMEKKGRKRSWRWRGGGGAGAGATTGDGGEEQQWVTNVEEAIVAKDKSCKCVIMGRAIGRYIVIYLTYICA
jgi:hypothetical protein